MPADPYATRADPYATRADGLGPMPTGQLPTGLLGDLRPPPFSGGGPRSRRRLVPAVIVAAVVAVVAIAAGALIFRSHSASTATSGTTGTTPSASPQASRQQAAARLSGLLASSVTDRSAVIDAVGDVSGCGPSMPQDAQTFTRAADSRQRLLSQLANLPGRSLLSAEMLQDLTGAWQASAQVHTDLARWTNDNIARGCHRKSHSDAALRSSYVPDGQATTDKQAFARLWNPVARQYGLTTYHWNQL
jgi:hypothetical protein